MAETSSQNRCWSCQELIKPTDKFCSHCGAAVASSVENAANPIPTPSTDPTSSVEAAISNVVHENYDDQAEVVAEPKEDNWEQELKRLTKQQAADKHANDRSAQASNRDIPNSGNETVATARSKWSTNSRAGLAACATILFGLIVYWFLGNGDPNCGSSATQNLVIRIAKSNPINRLTQKLMGTFRNSEKYKAYARQVLGDLPQEYNSACIRMAAQPSHNSCGMNFDSAYAWSGFLSIAEFIHSHSPDLYNSDLYQRSVDATKTMNSFEEEAIGNAAYSLNTIRTKSKDPETEAVSCVANLHGEIEDAVAEIAITYDEEKTSDASLYATVYGLN